MAERERIPLSDPELGKKPKTPRAKKPKSKAEKPERKKSTFRGSVLKLAVAWGLVAVIWMGVAGGIGLAWIAYDLPPIDSALSVTRRPTIQVLAEDGTQIARFGDLRGEALDVQDMPATLVQAVIATEDRRFYEHFGIDLVGVGRALVADIRARRIVQGGSTITQQAAKNLFLTPARSIKRKLQEMLLAIALEQRFTKNEILAIYLNRVYFGAGTYGVEAAAKAYFGVSARDLDLQQSAVIAGLLKAPSKLNPLTNPEGAKERGDVVLANMVDAGFLTEADVAGERKAHPLTFQPAQDERKIARYFVDWIMDQVEGAVGRDAGDLIIHTTLDPSLQLAAEAEVRATLDKSGEASHVSQAAALVMTPSGAIRAMVGGRNYADSQFNRAVQAQRQPGSSFKPIMYLAAVESGIGPEQVFDDHPINIGGWSPENFDQKYRGRMTLREAVAESINTVAVQVAQTIGVPKILNVARRLGLTTQLTPNLSIALGTGEVTLIELTSAYAALANGGDGVWAYGIDEIDTPQGERLYKRQGSGPGKVIELSDVATMNSLLSGVVQHGTGTAANIGRPIAGKTGTSGDFRDAWFMGYSADLVGGVWMGNDDFQPMKRVTGGGLPARLWHNIMLKAHQGLPARPLIGSDYVQPAPASPITGVSAPGPVQVGGQEEKSFWDKLRSILGGKG